MPPSTPSTMRTAEHHKMRRTANACVSCRQSKVKCSGDNPCANCQRRGVECQFTEEARKVSVSERYLHSLQTQARQRTEESRKRTHDDAFGETVDVANPESSSPGVNWPSPFSLPSMTMRNKNNNHRRTKWVWLAPSSTWSFTARLTLMMTQKLHPQETYDIPFFLDGDIYPLQWKSTSDDTPDIRDIPSIDYALYLFNTVKFHLGQVFRLLDEEGFTSHMHEFYYGDATKKVVECRLWFVQFLMVLAFGKAFLGQSGKDDPPGSEFFLRAMSLMPDYNSIWQDTLVATEALALAALYLYSIDRRESGQLYASQAIRIAQLEGLHTELPVEELGPKTLERCRNIWWTLYIIDRHFSSSLGLPVIVQDADITALIDSPKQSNPRNATLSLRVKLSRLLADILNAVYKTDSRPIESFIERTKSILNTMADLARELEEIESIKFKNLVNTRSKGMLHITLLYHQCAIFATRPLLLAVLRERLDKIDLPPECCRPIIPSMKNLVSAGVSSAARTLQLLSGLTEEGLLETFLPFDLEFTYDAALHLAMANALFPDLVGQRNHSHQAHMVLEVIISKGNRVADIRKAELSRLEVLFEGMILRKRDSNPRNSCAESVNLTPTSLDPGPETGAVTSQLTLDSENGNTEPPDLYGEDFISPELSSHELAALVDQINYGSNSPFWMVQG